MENNCFYCAKDQRLQDLMIEVRQLDTATLYLFKEQTYRGRCVVAYNRHVRHLTELSELEVAAFWKDVTRVAKALEKAFHPDKINYGIYGDTNPHLHCHVVPKYEGGFSWGGTFEMMPKEKKLLSEGEYQALIEEIKKYL
ncbi:MAG: HIT family protein [Bacteroidota bacterium]